ncbi:MAG: hypothetical protein Barrevirus14_20 [Barrevirus sp.]|uniref:Uncharacterized protein n=1 Tax=Barrevirus sp. TaxID=2487763 RepID=A0A3G4ZT19_9VIRU|nr:MAG: hypothetical protein Barrevirus14_20 [Barrevirus sp.]
MLKRKEEKRKRKRIMDEPVKAHLLSILSEIIPNIWSITEASNSYLIYNGGNYTGAIDKNLASLTIDSLGVYATPLIQKLEIAELTIKFVLDHHYVNLYNIIKNKLTITSFSLSCHYLHGQKIIELFQLLPKTNIVVLTLDASFSKESIDALINILPKTKIRSVELEHRHGFNETFLLDFAKEIIKVISLQKLDFSFLNDNDLENQLISILQSNITLTCLPNGNRSDGFDKLEKRNQKVQHIISRSIITFILVKRLGLGLHEIPYEIVIMIAKFLYLSRSDLIWLQCIK